MRYKLVIRLLFLSWLGLVVMACGATEATPTSIVLPTPTEQALATVVPPTATLEPTVQATPLTLAFEWDGYTTYVAQPGDTLAAVSSAGGSLPVFVQRYNRFDAPELAVGQIIVVPQFPGYDTTLEAATVVVTRGLTTQPRVALTFDAGADAAPTAELLLALRSANVQVTFFLTGQWISDNPNLVQALLADGHELANHTFSHPDLTTLELTDILAELETTEAALTALVGPEVSIRPFARPPYGALDPQVSDAFAQAGYLPILWTLDSLDSVGEPKSPEFLFERVTTGLAADQLAGAIILLHVGSQSTAEAMPNILAWFAENGYAVVPLSKVMLP